MSAFSLVISLSSSVAQWLLESKTRKGETCIRDYLEWLRRKEQTQLVQLIEQSSDSVEAIDYLISQNFDFIESVKNELITKIESHDQNTQTALSEIKNILDEKLKNVPADKGRIAIAHGVLEALAMGINDPHVRVVFRKEHDLHKQGSILTRFEQNLSRDWTVMDLIGDIRANRISVIVLKDKSVEMRLINNVGDIVRARSLAGAVSFGLKSHIAGTWDTEERKIALYINGELAQVVTDERIKLDFLGPVLLIGADIEGETSNI